MHLEDGDDHVEHHQDCRTEQEEEDHLGPFIRFLLIAAMNRGGWGLLELSLVCVWGMDYAVGHVSTSVERRRRRRRRFSHLPGPHSLLGHDAEREGHQPEADLQTNTPGGVMLRYWEGLRTARRAARIEWWRRASPPIMMRRPPLMPLWWAREARRVDDGTRTPRVKVISVEPWSQKWKHGAPIRPAVF